MIYLFDTMRLQVREERFEGWFFLGNEYTATCIPVDAVYQCWTKSQTIMSPPEIILSLIYEVGFRGFVVSCMYIDSCRLVDDHEILIFIENRESHRSSISHSVFARILHSRIIRCTSTIFCLHSMNLLITHPESELISEFELVGLILFFAIYLDLASTQESIYSTERNIREEFFAKSVDTLSRIG